MKDEKSLLEEILDRKKSIKNGLLDNDEDISSSKNQKFSETKKNNPSQNNISKNSALRNKNNEKMKLQRSISFIKSKETIILNLSKNIRKIAKKIFPINRKAMMRFDSFFAFRT